MLGSNNVNEIIGEISYIFEVVEAFLEKKDLSHSFDEKIYGPTLKQINFLKKQRLPEEIPKYEYNNFKTVQLYRDVLESILGDMEKDNEDLLRMYAIDTYGSIKFSLDNLISVEEVEGLTLDASYLLNDMYDVVKGKAKQDYFKDFKADLLGTAEQ